MALPEKPSSKEEVVYDEEMSPLQKDDTREKFLPPCQDSFEEEEEAVSFPRDCSMVQSVIGRSPWAACVWMRLEAL